MGFLPVLHDRAPDVVVIGPLGFWRGGPPEAGGAVFGAAAGLGPEADHVVATGEPEIAFRAEEAGTLGVDEVPEPFGMKWPPGTENKAADPVFLGLGCVLVVQLPEPTRRGLGFFHVEAAGVEDAIQRNAAALDFEDFGTRIEMVEDGAELLEFGRGNEIGFID